MLTRLCFVYRLPNYQKNEIIAMSVFVVAGY